jgi:hypothetical protein
MIINSTNIKLLKIYIDVFYFYNNVMKQNKENEISARKDLNPKVYELEKQL